MKLVKIDGQYFNPEDIIAITVDYDMRGSDGNHSVLCMRNRDKFQVSVSCAEARKIVCKNV